MTNQTGEIHTQSVFITVLLYPMKKPAAIDLSIVFLIHMGKGVYSTSRISRRISVEGVRFLSKQKASTATKLSLTCYST